MSIALPTFQMSSNACKYLVTSSTMLGNVSNLLSFVCAFRKEKRDSRPFCPLYSFKPIFLSNAKFWTEFKVWGCPIRTIQHTHTPLPYLYESSHPFSYIAFYRTVSIFLHIIFLSFFLHNTPKCMPNWDRPLHFNGRRFSTSRVFHDQIKQWFTIYLFISQLFFTSLLDRIVWVRMHISFALQLSFNHILCIYIWICASTIFLWEVFLPYLFSHSLSLPSFFILFFLYAHLLQRLLKRQIKRARRYLLQAIPFNVIWKAISFIVWVLERWTCKRNWWKYGPRVVPRP